LAILMTLEEKLVGKSKDFYFIEDLVMLLVLYFMEDNNKQSNFKFCFGQNQI